jgi:hypothetical protein
MPLTSCASSSQFVMEPSRTLVVPKSSNLLSVNDYFKRIDFHPKYQMNWRHWTMTFQHTKFCLPSIEFW